MINGYWFFFSRGGMNVRVCACMFATFYAQNITTSTYVSTGEKDHTGFLQEGCPGRSWWSELIRVELNEEDEANHISGLFVSGIINFSPTRKETQFLKKPQGEWWLSGEKFNRLKCQSWYRRRTNFQRHVKDLDKTMTWTMFERNVRVWYGAFFTGRWLIMWGIWRLLLRNSK